MHKRTVWAMVAGLFLATVLVTPSLAHHTQTHIKEQFNQQAQRLTNQSSRIRAQRADIVDHRDRLIDLEDGVFEDGLTVQGELVAEGDDNATSFRLRGPSDLDGDGVADSISQSYAGIFYHPDFDNTGGPGAKTTRASFGSNEDMDLEFQGSNHIRITAVDGNVGNGRIRLAAEDEIQLHAGAAAETNSLDMTVQDGLVSFEEMLQLKPQTSAPVACDATQLGKVYYQQNAGAGDDQLLVCTDAGYQSLN